MLKRSTQLILCTLTSASAIFSGTQLSAQTGDAGLIVHEWGTFTSVAGEDGLAVEWLPLSGPSDLPCFVYHYQNDPLIKLSAGTRRLDYGEARSHLWGRVRMETPVIYFYSPREVSLGVRVQFRRGLITEWYPEAVVSQTVVSPHVLRDAGQTSAIEWRVRLTPGSRLPFPREPGPSHYYAARATHASPLRTDRQTEKFLFYRGAGNFDVPLKVRVVGPAIQITNLAHDPLDGVIVFENRSGRIGYRTIGIVRNEVTSARPATGVSSANLRRELEQILVKAGLYPAEAAAMVETWKDSWFEEGTRVFYLMPERVIDSILPLAITPSPVAITRVFVGRVDILTPESERAVHDAITTGNVAVLERYGRLAGPIADHILAKTPDAEHSARIHAALNATFAKYLSQSRTCE